MPGAIRRACLSQVILGLRDRLPTDDDMQSTACLRRRAPTLFPCAEGRLHNPAAAPRRTFRTIIAASCSSTVSQSTIDGILPIAVRVWRRETSLFRIRHRWIVPRNPSVADQSVRLLKPSFPGIGFDGLSLRRLLFSLLPTQRSKTGCTKCLCRAFLNAALSLGI
jgi:hypothetical protein